MKMTKSIHVLVVLLMFFVGKVGANTVEQYLQQAEAKFKRGDLESAAVLYQKVIKLDENNLTARKKLAAILIQAKMKDPESEYSGADLAVIQEATPIHPLPHYHFSLIDLANITLSPNDKHLKHESLRALTQLRQGDHDSAIQTANALKRKSPDHPVAHNLLGLAWVAKGDINQARNHFEKALSLKEDFYAARINLANLEIQAKNYSKARLNLDKVIASDKNNRQAHLSLAKLSDLEGKTKESKHWVRQVSQHY